MLPDGVFAACLTPLKSNLDVDNTALVRHCRWLLANGCDGLAPLGSTGEANSFSVLERKKLLDVLIESGLQPECLLVGTGCCAIPDACDLTRHAIAHGVGGVLMLPPFFYKGVSDEGVFRYYEQIIQNIGESRLRIYLYHFPKMTGVPIDEPLIERLLKTYPRTVVGMKDSGGDWNHMKSICQRFPEFRVYAGSEQFLLDILKIGGVGCISASTNITCTMASKVFHAWRSKNATELQDALNRVRGVIEKYPLIPALKQVMANATGNHDWLNMRPPFATLNENEASKIEKNLNKLGFSVPSIEAQ
jgi:4-hydroxy-tetrahydrodipicolinate synthase